MENNILHYEVDEAIGVIDSVDTGTATASITEDEELSKLQINQLLAIKSPHPGRHIIGMIVKIFRRALLDRNDFENPDSNEEELRRTRQTLWSRPCRC